MTEKDNFEISVAPMMDWTDRHCRYFHRQIAPHVRLYTEMLTTGAILCGNRERLLRFDPAEQPVALQLGGADPEALAACAKIGEAAGYSEINLNCGCPSMRVQEGRFGACLMREPKHVADCIGEMIEAVDVPVTVKCRIGIDKQDDFAFLDDFISKIAAVGCGTFIIHARKAWLKGLNPKENREIPKLQYERAAEIKAKYPELHIILNGGITDVEQIKVHRRTFDGVMIGREAYGNPWLLADIEREIFGNHHPVSRETVALKMFHYAKEQKELHGTPVKSITRHILGLYHEQPRAKSWRRALSTLSHEDGADESVILRALETMEEKKLAA